MKGSAAFAVLSAPIEAPQIYLIMFPQQTRSPIGERIDDRPGAFRRIVVELGAGPIDIPRMIEVAQPMVRAVDRSPHKVGDVSRAQEPMSRNVANDGNVVFSHPEGWRFRCAAETRSAGYARGSCAIAHAFILAVVGVSSSRIAGRNNVGHSLSGSAEACRAVAEFGAVSRS